MTRFCGDQKHTKNRVHSNGGLKAFWSHKDFDKMTKFSLPLNLFLLLFFFSFLSFSSWLLWIYKIKTNMGLTSVLLLAVLFFAGLINIFFYFPTNKFLVWFQSLFQATSTSTTTTPPSPTSKQRNTGSSQNRAEGAAELKQVFGTFDKNSDGFITKQELKESLKNIRIFMSDKEVEEMVMKVDANGDGLIDFDEFCLLCESMMMRSQEVSREEEEEEELKEAFGVFDKDKDGLISVEELGVVLCSLGLREGNKVEDCKEMVRKVDRDGDGMVNFDEFKKMMKGGRLLLAH